MRRRKAQLIFIAVFAISGTGWIGVNECRAALMTIASIVADNGGNLTVGGLTFTFNGDSVTSDTFLNGNKPTAADIIVTTVVDGVRFSLSNPAVLAGQTSMTASITIKYSVASTIGLSTAGLSFRGEAGGVDASSSVKETISGDADATLNVYTIATNDMPKDNNNQNNQSAALAGTPMNLSVTDVGTLFIPNRGDGAKNGASLLGITNTFGVPEPSTFVLAAIATLVGLGVGLRGQAGHSISWAYPSRPGHRSTPIAATGECRIWRPVHSFRRSVHPARSPQ